MKKSPLMRQLMTQSLYQTLILSTLAVGLAGCFGGGSRINIQKTTPPVVVHVPVPGPTVTITTPAPVAPVEDPQPAPAPVIHAPLVEGILPPEGLTTGRFTAWIRGQHFVPSTATVVIGENIRCEIDLEHSTETLLLCNVGRIELPRPRANIAVPVTVDNNNGTAPSRLEGQFTFNNPARPAVRITSVRRTDRSGHPDSIPLHQGYPTGGYQIAIAGNHFRYTDRVFIRSGALEVECENVDVSNQITCDIPARHPPAGPFELGSVTIILRNQANRFLAVFPSIAQDRQFTFIAVPVPPVRPVSPVLHAPIVHGIIPAEGVTTGGFDTWIRGQHFNTQRAHVLLGEMPCLINQALSSDTLLVCHVTPPLHQPRPAADIAVSVIVNNNNGTALGQLDRAFTFRNPARPTVHINTVVRTTRTDHPNTVAPHEGYNTGGYRVAIDGNHFNFGDRVFIRAGAHEVECEGVENESETRLTCAIPNRTDLLSEPFPIGPVTVTLRNEQGGFLAVFPALAEHGPHIFTFLQVPPPPPVAQITAVVRSDLGNHPANTAQHRGFNTGGYRVTIHGSHFRPGVTASIRTSQTAAEIPCAALNPVSDTQLTCLIPDRTSATAVPFPAGPITVTVRNTDGTAPAIFPVNPTDPAFEFILPDPVINNPNGVTPAQGFNHGSFQVTIHGHHFAVNSATVSLGGTDCAVNRQRSTNTSLVCRVGALAQPLPAAGPVLVIVDNQNGTTPARLENGFTFTQLARPAPHINSVVRTEIGDHLPSTAYNHGYNTGGYRVNINGSHFREGATVSLRTSQDVNEIPCEAVRLESRTQLTCLIPDRTRLPSVPFPLEAITVTVRNTDGSAPAVLAHDAPNAFTFIAVPPLVTSVRTVNPHRGLTTGNFDLRISGRHLDAAVTVLLGQTPCIIDAARTRADLLVCHVPQNPQPVPVAGAVTVILQRADGTQLLQLDNAFTFFDFVRPTAQITSIVRTPIPGNHPASVAATRGHTTGGYTITLTGDHFRDNATVSFHSNQDATNEIPCTPVVRLTRGTQGFRNQLTCLIPDRTSATAVPFPAGPITVTVRNTDGTAPAIFPVNPTDPAFEFILPDPIVNSITPNSAPVTGLSDDIIIVGQNFRPAGMTVWLGVAPTSTPCVINVPLSTPTRLVCNIPAVIGPPARPEELNAPIIFRNLPDDGTSVQSPVTFRFFTRTVTQITSVRRLVNARTDETSPFALNTFVDPTGNNPLGTTILIDSPDIRLTDATITVDGAPCLNIRRYPRNIGIGRRAPLMCDVAARPELQLPLTLPIGPIDVRVSYPDGRLMTLDRTHPNAFQLILPDPIVDSITPDHDTVRGNFDVTIHGSNFGISATVSLGDIPCNTNLAQSTRNTLVCHVDAITPARRPGQARVSITNPGLGGHEVRSNIVFTFDALPDPQITAVLHAGTRLNQGETTLGYDIILQGAHLSTGDGVSINLAGVLCQNIRQPNPQADPADLLTCFLPARTTLPPPNRPLPVGPVGVILSYNDGRTCNLGRSQPAAFRLTPPVPVITAINPQSGLNSGNYTITLQGTDFRDNPIVMIGRTACINPQVTPDGRTLTCTIPAGPITRERLVSVTVTNADGTPTATLPNSFTFTTPRQTIAAVIAAAAHNLAHLIGFDDLGAPQVQQPAVQLDAALPIQDVKISHNWIGALKEGNQAYVYSLTPSISWTSSTHPVLQDQVQEAALMGQHILLVRNNQIQQIPINGGTPLHLGGAAISSGDNPLPFPQGTALPPNYRPLSLHTSATHFSLETTNGHVYVYSAPSNGQRSVGWSTDPVQNNSTGFNSHTNPVENIVFAGTRAILVTQNQNAYLRNLANGTAIRDSIHDQSSWDTTQTTRFPNGIIPVWTPVAVHTDAVRNHVTAAAISTHFFALITNTHNAYIYRGANGGGAEGQALWNTTQIPVLNNQVSAVALSDQWIVILATTGHIYGYPAHFNPALVGSNFAWELTPADLSQGTRNTSGTPMPPVVVPNAVSVVAQKVIIHTNDNNAYIHRVNDGSSIFNTTSMQNLSGNVRSVSADPNQMIFLEGAPQVNPANFSVIDARTSYSLLWDTFAQNKTILEDAKFTRSHIILEHQKNAYFFNRTNGALQATNSSTESMGPVWKGHITSTTGAGLQAILLNDAGDVQMYNPQNQQITPVVLSLDPEDKITQMIGTDHYFALLTHDHNVLVYDTRRVQNNVLPQYWASTVPVSNVAISSSFIALKMPGGNISIRRTDAPDTEIGSIPTQSELLSLSVSNRYLVFTTHHAETEVYGISNPRSPVLAWYTTSGRSRLRSTPSSSFGVDVVVKKALISDQHVALVISGQNNRSNVYLRNISNGMPVFDTTTFGTSVTDRVEGISLSNDQIILRTLPANLNITNYQGQSVWDSATLQDPQFSSKIVDFDLNDTGFSVVLENKSVHYFPLNSTQATQVGPSIRLTNQHFGYSSPENSTVVLSPTPPNAHVSAEPAMSVQMSDHDILVHTFNNHYELYDPTGAMIDESSLHQEVNIDQHHITAARALQNRIVLQFDDNSVYTGGRDQAFVQISPPVQLQVPLQLSASNFSTMLTSNTRSSIFPWNNPGTSRNIIFQSPALMSKVSNHHMAILTAAHSLDVYDYASPMPVWQSAGQPYDGHIQSMRLSDYHVVLTTDGAAAADGTIVPRLLILDVVDGRILFPNVRDGDLAQPICPIGVTCGPILEN